MSSIEAIHEWLDRHVVSPRAGMVDTNRRGLRVIKLEMTTEPFPSMYDPVLSVVIQGAKRVVFGRRVLDCAAGQYFVLAQQIPVTSQVMKASRERPFVAVSIKLNARILAELPLEEAMYPELDGVASGLGVGKAPEEVLEALLRLLRLTDRPRDLAVLAPSVEREIHWYLLRGEHGALVRQAVNPEGAQFRVSQAIRWIRQHFAEPLKVGDLAKLAGMSVPTFHRHFRLATDMSPLQYQKQVRLQEARNRLISQGQDVASIGFSVGYNSPSQFSREYRRTYGLPPSVDGAALRSGDFQDKLVQT